MDERQLIEEARAWIEDDPDPTTRSELEALIEAGDLVELRERFSGRLEFGTAGIRGALGAGPARMNRALVRRVTAGLAVYLLDVSPDVKRKGVVVGRDARHLSREFAEDTAAVFNGFGIPTHVFSDIVPTPVCAYAVTALGAAGGVMVTASHNPPEDNGYKVYWENGAQIIPPHDRGISAAIDRIAAPGEIPFLNAAEATERSLLHAVPASLEEQYIQAVLALRRHPELPSDLGIVYTPLHGVGGKWVTTVLERAGFPEVHAVPEQVEPDPEFPTVRFPNPEEEGAMDLALDLARRVGAEIILANDPDADRLAVIARNQDGYYRPLTGNEIGVALAYYLLTENPDAEKPLVMTTIVSSSLLKKMASALYAGYAETLTGYKWIANTAIDLRRKKGYSFVFGYEEALGYTVGELVRDKDGVGAALVFADLAAFCASRGETVFDWIEAIYRRFGLHMNGAKSVTLPGSEGAHRIEKIMDGMRNSPPSEVGGIPVAARGDLLTGLRRDRRTGEETPLDFPESNVLFFELEDGSRILVRPSGTEPKIKFYFEVVQPIAENEPFANAEERAKQHLEGLMDAFLSGAEIEV